MNLQLTKSLCVFDLETTGLQINTDRIVQIAIIKLDHSGERTELNQLINPEMIIPQEVIDIHGVSNELIQDKPTFSQFAPELIEFIGDADLAGYNSNKFDIPVLAEEFLTSLADFSRAGNFELIDLAGRLARNEKGEAMYNFGKHKGKTIKEVSKVEPGYFGWMTSDQTDFPRYTKVCLRREMEKIKEAEKKDAPITENNLESLKNKFNTK